MRIVFIYIIPAIIIIFGLYLAIYSDLLKDKSKIQKKPYSFARTQLLWWSLIILSLFSLSYGENSQIPELNSSTLILLGISLVTVAAARIIDNNDANNYLVRHQDIEESKGFIIDILSDENGISIHRFQALLFNIIFGIIFIHHFFISNAFVEFNSTELGLMGISSAAYIGMKLFENQKSESKTALTDDDLRDIDEDYTKKNDIEVG